MSLVPSYPDLQGAYQNREQDLAPALAGMPPHIARVVARMDQQRLNRGASPLPRAQQAAMIRSAETLQEQVKQPDRNWFMRGVDDLASTVKSLPHLPVALAQEALQLPHLPQQFATAVGEADNPLQAVGNVAQLPGVRMLPGSFIAANALGGVNPETGERGSISELGKHPLFTALDLLPAAHEAASLTKAGRAAEVAGKAVLPTVFTRTVDEAGALAPNRLGRLVDVGKARLEPTAVGQLWGAPSRQMAKQAGRAESDIMLRAKVGLDADVARIDKDFSAGRIDANEASVRKAQAEKNATVLQQLTQRGDDLVERAQKMLDVDGVRDLTRRMETGDWEGMTGPQSKIAAEYRDWEEQAAAFSVSQGWLGEVELSSGREVMERSVANRLQRKQGKVAFTEPLARAAEAVANPASMSVDDVLGEVSGLAATAEGHGKFRVGWMAQQTQAWAEALAVRGYDPTPLRRAAGKFKTKDGPAGWGAAIDKALGETRLREGVPEGGWGNQGAVTAVGQIAEVLRGSESPTATKASAVAERVVTQVKDGNYRDALIQLRDIRRQSRFRDHQGLFDEAIDAVKVQQRAQKTLRKLEGAQKAADKAEAALKVAVAESPPDRFAPLIEQRVKEKLSGVIRDRYSHDPAAIDTYFKMLDAEQYDLIGVPKEELFAIRDEIKATWQDLAAQGFDPVFVHRVPESAAKHMARPTLLREITKPSQVKERAFLPHSNYRPDFTVGLEHQALELLQRRATEDFFVRMTDDVGRTHEDLVTQYLPVAERRAAATGTAVGEELRKLIDRDWKKVDEVASNPLRTGASPLTKTADTRFIPKGVARNLERMHTPKFQQLGGWMDPVMKVFRTAVLPLSPRWHAGNTFGGYLMLSAHTDPAAAFKYFKKARELMREGAPEGLDMAPIGQKARDAGLGGSVSSLTRDTEMLSDWSKKWRRAQRGDKAAQTAILQGQMGLAGGVYARQLLDNGFVDKAGNFVKGSYRLNEAVDNFYRAVAYLYGEDKALRKGLTKEQAEARGAALSREAMVSWDELTPLERSAGKFVFPFYGFTQYLLRSTAKYPATHPWRTNLLMHVAKTEREDFQSGLPERLFGSFFLGDPDVNGNVKTVNLNGLNPYSDVANYFSAVGFAWGGGGDLGKITGSMNPIISGMLKAVGVDPTAGAPDVYMEQRYDPETGRMVADVGKDGAWSFIESAVPQVGALRKLTGFGSASFRDLAVSNPDAASRMMQSQLFGLPSVYRDTNLAEEAYKAEKNRYENAQEAKRQALKSGDYQDLRKWEVFGPLVQQLAAYDQAGLLDRYRPEQGDPDMFKVLRGAVTYGQAN